MSKLENFNKRLEVKIKEGLVDGKIRLSNTPQISQVISSMPKRL